MSDDTQNRKLFVGNLAYSVRDADLRKHFEQAGTVEDVVVMMDKFKVDYSRGFGFVVMSSEAEAQKAIEMFHDQELAGRPIIVNVAKPLEERPPRRDW